MLLDRGPGAAPARIHRFVNLGVRRLLDDLGYGCGRAGLAGLLGSSTAISGCGFRPGRSGGRRVGGAPMVRSYEPGRDVDQLGPDRGRGRSCVEARGEAASSAGQDERHSLQDQPGAVWRGKILRVGAPAAPDTVGYLVRDKLGRKSQTTTLFVATRAAWCRRQYRACSTSNRSMRCQRQDASNDAHDGPHRERRGAPWGHRPRAAARSRASLGPSGLPAPRPAP